MKEQSGEAVVVTHEGTGVRGLQSMTERPGGRGGGTAREQEVAGGHSLHGVSLSRQIGNSRKPNCPMHCCI